MYYPELKDICESVFSDIIIEKIDSWLAFMTDEESNNITVSRMSQQLGIPIKISRSILEELADVKILKRVFGLLCPECNLLLKTSDEENLINDISKEIYCYGCGASNIIIEKENIDVRYILIKKFDNPIKIDSIAEKISKGKKTNEEDLISKIIENNYNVNNLFYMPSNDDYDEMESLLNGILNQHKNTKLQGDVLENLARKIFSCIKGFESVGAHTKTNQIDCYVVNKCGKIPNSTLERLGNIIYCECKNEKKKPDNTYYHKLHSIIVLANFEYHDIKVGVVLSRLNPTSVCDEVARQIFDKEKLYLINFELNELKEIVLQRKNFLDYIRLKLDILEKRLTSDATIKKAYLG